MPDLEAIGDAATGAVLAGAVERAGRKGDGHTHESACLNCGTQLSGEFCYVCGQRAHVHRSLSAFFHDLLHGVFHFEGKIWTTLPMLIWKPGQLTRGYIDGQRARYVSPIALFLFCVFLMFAVVSATGLGEIPEQVKADVATQVKDHEATLTRQQAERAQREKADRSTVGIDAEIAQTRRELDGLKRLQARGIEGSAVQVSDDMPGWFRSAVEHALKNPELVLYKLKSNAYKFSWALIPLSVPFVWLLFPFSRRFRLYDHTVFVTYSLCFMLLLLMVGTLLDFVAPSIASLLWFVPPIHMYRQLRGTYELSRWGAIWRATLLTLFAFVAAMLFLIVLVAMGLF
ncbi:DUF3667 domain-containing protein [Sphingomonas sp. SM33]|uniref:DUF3667 domain-containing protein n=1 Tax=Sphingomonas telluris TaxID=2907998 RepID=A0ABS9VN24_9SPHN|nr:DUF3667 domain-containing protein [Sphingomonas telluris]MCH8616376.1 DUF3667 domain-containing protein [Sphingomonas telluris]